MKFSGGSGGSQPQWGWGGGKKKHGKKKKGEKGGGPALWSNAVLGAFLIVNLNPAQMMRRYRQCRKAEVVTMQPASITRLMRFPAERLH